MKTLAETTPTTAVAAENGDLERKERESRSLALEKAYVHDVYDQLSHHFSEERYRPWPRVRQFLEQLEPGSLVCDAGCGNGKYLQVNPSIFKVGSDRCAASVDVARRKDHEVLICDALNLPYRDESFDAALSIAVIHHLATRDRRVRALRELARILRVGGRILITVWAKEQRHRKFESQDILVPWRTPDRSSSEEKAEVGGNEHESIATTTTTSDEDVTHYHAYSQTSESDSCYSCSKVHHSRCPSDCSGCLAVAGTSAAAAADGELPPCTRRRHHRPHHKGRSFDPHRPSCSSQSSSDLSSPSDSCYSFVRKALQKLASTRRAVGNGHHRRSWFTLGESIEHQHGAWSCAGLEATDPSNELPIELRHLDSEEDGALLGSAAAMTQTNERISRSSPPSLGGKGDSSIFFGSEPPVVAEQNNAADSSSSISPILPRRSSSSSLAAGGVSSSSSTGTQQPSQQSHGSRSLSLSDLLHSLPVSVSSWLRHRLSEEDASSSLISPGSELERPIDPYSPPPPSDQDQIRRSVRPMLTKQKRVVQIFESYCEEEDDPGLLVPVAQTDDRQSLLALPKAQPRVFKQGSMNDSLLSAERLKEREKLKQSLLPRQVTWSGAPTSSPLVVPESSLRPSPPPPPPQPSVTPPAKQTPTHRPSPSPQPPPPAPPSEIGEALKDFTSLRNGFVRIWQTLRGDSSSSSPSSSSSKTHLLLDDRNCDKPWLLDSPTGNETPHPARSLPQRRPPSLLEKRIKSFCGWGIAEESATGSMSPSPRRLPPVAGSEEDFFNFSLPRCCADQDLTFSRSVHPHRLSCQREEGSDSSSKDSSLQSDTSVDSEDSCVSVIYVPRPGDHKGELEGNGLMVDPSVAKTRNNSSSSSDGSPKVKVFPTLLSFAAELTDPAPVKSPGMTAAQQEGVQTTNSPQRQSCLRQPNALAASNETVDKVLTRSVVPHFQQEQQQQQARPVHRLLSFEVFNPETDDMDSDSDCGDNSSTTSESSSSNSAGSVISVGDPMWPAFQDRRQTILSGSSLDFQTSASCDLVSSEQADNSLIKQDSNDSWPASIEDPSAQLTSSSHTSRHNQSSPVSLVATGIQESQESKSSPSPSLGESSTGGSSAKQQQQQEIHSDVEEWRVRSSLGPLDECHEEEGAELGDAFQYNKSLQQQQQTQQSAGVQQQQQQWKLEKVKGSFSASTSSLDSSISAPSYSSARQSSSASAISTASEMRKSSDDSTGFMSTLPLLRSRVANCAAASSSAAAGASASSTTGFHQNPSAAGSGCTGIRASGNKPINCGDDEFCSKPLNKMLLGGCGGDQRQRSADRDSSLSISTSQDSLPSDAGGSNMGSGGGGGNSGTVTLHRYYHVFRQGELDQLIERYVDSLHIISSYYDHANHCVVAEKVHVWTI